MVEGVSRDHHKRPDPTFPERDLPRGSKYRGRKPYGIEILWPRWRRGRQLVQSPWCTYWRAYRTEARRDEALRVLQRKSTIFRYRKREVAK